jgi:hypothetical protein
LALTITTSVKFGCLYGNKPDKRACALILGAARGGKSHPLLEDRRWVHVGQRPQRQLDAVAGQLRRHRDLLATAIAVSFAIEAVI